jgi:hypothetical protein
LGSPPADRGAEWRRLEVSTNGIYAELCALAGSGRKARLTRARPEEPLKNGFIVAVSPVLTALAQFHDFYPDGYAVVLTGDITAVRSGEYERHWERMFSAERIAVEGEPLRGLPLDDLPALLAGLATWEENVIVQCEDAEERVEDFYIGRIIRVGDGAVAFSNFDGLGRWDPEPTEIEVGDITQVQLRTPYAQTFSKYLEGPCPHV